MNHFNVFIVIAISLLSLPCIAQKKSTGSPQQPFERMRIGDIVPMESITFDNVRNYPGGTAKLSDFKGKYIILDFWSKGCDVCIAMFPKMEELQNEFNDDLRILLVTKDTQEDLAMLLKNSPNLKKTKLPVVIGDRSLATQLFPHNSVPYHVWLDRTGKVVATTYAQETNSKNLKKLISGMQLDLPVKNINFDVDFIKELQDTKLSLIKVGGGGLQKFLKYYALIPQAKTPNMLPLAPSGIPSLPYYSFFMSYLPGDLSWGQGKLVDTNGKTVGLRYYNWPLNSLYLFAYEEELGQPLKLILENEKARQYFEERTDTTNSMRYTVNNSFCYESRIPDYNLLKAKDILKQDLARFIGLTASIEERLVKHIVLTRLDIKEEQKIWMKNQKLNQEIAQYGKVNNGFSFRNVSFKALVSAIEVANGETTDPVIVDESGLSQVMTYVEGRNRLKRVDILLKCQTLKCTEENIPLIRKELAKYGIDLKEEMRSVKALVLRANI